jgi:bifunctional non-homologous end joining protein LigD
MSRWRYPVDVSRVPFIPPAIPRLRSSPPAGDGWTHELKLDGYCVRLHKAGQAVTIYSENGADFTRRFPTIATAVLALPVSSCIIDGELIAAGAAGEPDF